jgi:acetyl esterase/lipase
MDGSMKFTSALALLASLSLSVHAADAPSPPVKPAPARPKTEPPAPNKTPPTVENLHYGPHEGQVLDFYQVKSDKPTPLVFQIHGGSWLGGDKNNPPALKDYLDAGISVVSINYRFVWQAKADGVSPPVKAPLEDAARALQFVRSKAKEWNIDKERIGATGGSAGACSSLWLDFHPDMADPKSSDPISRESTRVWCTAVNIPQTTLDPKQMKEWTPNSRYGGHAFGFNADAKNHLSQFDVFLANREKILPWIAEYSPYALVTSDDPPVYMFFTKPPAVGQDQEDPTHTANFGVKLQEHCKEVGVPCELMYPGAPNVKHRAPKDYLIEKLKAPSAR